jgi:hypothetical protein
MILLRNAICNISSVVLTVIVGIIGGEVVRKNRLFSILQQRKSTFLTISRIAITVVTVIIIIWIA